MGCQTPGGWGVTRVTVVAAAVVDERSELLLRRTMSTLATRSDLRGWQADALARLATWGSGTFLISAAPGAGKTRPSLEFARAEFMARRLAGLVVVCPTAPLTRQWARAAHELGLHLLPDADGPAPPAGFHGVVVTYARVGRDPAAWGGVAAGTLVIADEAHHLGEELTWGQGFAAAFASASRWLLLSGTPFRSDRTSIPGVEYDGDGMAEADITYSYADAVADGVCRPMTFVPFDGDLAWRSNGIERQATFADELARGEHGRRYRTAISTELEDGLPRILGEAHDRLRVIRGEHPDAGGLVVTADSEHAQAVADVLYRLTGESPVVVLYTDPEAHRRLQAFKESAAQWIVAVNMVSEGVDIPRLRVGVYATTAKTAMIFRQIVGRFVRTVPGRPVEPSWLFLPGDPTLRDHAARIESELAMARKQRRKEQVGEGFGDFDPQLSLEDADGPLAFEPLSASVETERAVMTTSAPPGHVTVAGGAAAPGPGESTDVLAVDGWPVFERRAWLLEERNRLVGVVSETHRRTRRQVLGWANREVGADGSNPTVDQLEGVVELLLRRTAPLPRQLKAS